MNLRQSAIVLGVLALLVLLAAILSPLLGVLNVTPAGQPYSAQSSLRRSSAGDSQTPPSTGIAARMAKNLPETLAGLPRSTVATGAQAAQEISQLHEGRSGNLDSFIVLYEEPKPKPRRRIKVWVSVSADASRAAQLIARMTEGIKAMASQGQMYSMPRPFRTQGFDVLETRDLHVDTENYYWQDDNQVVWLETGGNEPAFSRKALRAWIDNSPSP